MQAGLETFNQQPCSPESCHSVTLAKVLLFGKAPPFFAKKGHCSNLIFGAVNTLAFWTPKSGPPQYVEEGADALGSTFSDFFGKGIKLKPTSYDATVSKMAVSMGSYVEINVASTSHALHMSMSRWMPRQCHASWGLQTLASPRIQAGQAQPAHFSQATCQFLYRQLLRGLWHGYLPLSWCSLLGRQIGQLLGLPLLCHCVQERITRLQGVLDHHSCKAYIFVLRQKLSKAPRSFQKAPRSSYKVPRKLPEGSQKLQKALRRLPEAPGRLLEFPSGQDLAKNGRFQWFQKRNSKAGREAAKFEILPHSTAVQVVQWPMLTAQVWIASCYHSRKTAVRELSSGSASWNELQTPR